MDAKDTKSKGYRPRKFYAETHLIPHTRTMHMTREDIRALQQWMIDNTQHQYHISVRKTKRAVTHGLYSVVVYIADDDLWPLFKLTWGHHGIQ